MISHLKVGPGAACTGQVRLCSERTETVTAGSTLLEALGRLGPIGSKILTLKDGNRGGAFLQPCQEVTDNNLAEGTGKPCAGHDRQNGSDSRFSTVELFSPRLNIGADPPIGSKS